jgi:excisionase family DNA binding protein
VGGSIAKKTSSELNRTPENWKELQQYLLYPTMVTVEKKMLKLADVERELGVSRWTLYEWLKEGKIRGVRLPCGHYRVPRKEVEKFKLKCSSND